MFYLDQTKKWYQKEFAERIEHMGVVRSVIENAVCDSRYSFMVVLSAAIAVLGLLLSSPAVVIGAMLLSPLMGPIIALGFALCILDFGLLRQSLVSIINGILLALSIVCLSVYFSPLTDPTPEILARTQPNLFDLLVALFSGLAGGYAAIKRKGETIVGVAIATALMPPLAVIGYGLATSQWALAQGAALLFMTNLLTIALSVTMLAKWYGFGARHSPKHTIWQTILILGVFGALSLPLGVALKDIAAKGYVTKTAQSILNEKAKANDCRLSQFSIAFPKGKPVEVRATLLTKRYVPDTDKSLEMEMEEKLRQPVRLEIDQIIIAHAEEAKPEQIRIALANNPLAPPAATTPVTPAAVATAPDVALMNYAKETLSLPIKAQQRDEETKTLTMVIGNEPAMSTKSKRATEKALSERMPGWKVELVPESTQLSEPKK